MSITVAGNLDFGGVAKITNLPDPVSAQDAATRAFVLATVTGAGAEIEEAGAGPFNDYATAARHIMASNAAGIFTGVASAGFTVGQEIIFSHQGAGYTEFQHNTGSSVANRFFTGRQGLNLRIFDNETAVFRLVDTTPGATTDLRWELQSPVLPFAHASVNANGDVPVHNGTNWVTVAGFQTTSTINLTPSGAVGVVDITALASGGSVTLQPTAAFNINGFSAKPEGFWFDLIYRDTTTHAGTLNENAGNTTTSIRNPGAVPYGFSTQQLIRMRYQNARWRAHPTTFVGARGQIITVTPGGGSAAGGVYLESDLAILSTTTNVCFEITGAGDVQIASLPDSPGRRLVLSKTNAGVTERIVLLHFSALETTTTKRFAVPRETSALVIARRLETREFVNYAATNSGGRFWVLADGMGGRENYLDNAAGDIMVHSGSEWSKVNLSAQGTSFGRPAAGGAGVPVALTGLQQGQNARRGTYYIDSTTTGVVATYTIPEDATQIVFTGSGSIILHGATIIAGKTIDWAVDAAATVEVEFVNDGAPTITQERFRGPGNRNVTIRAGESVTTTHYLNRHRIGSVAKKTENTVNAATLAGTASLNVFNQEISATEVGASWRFKLYWRYQRDAGSPTLTFSINPGGGAPGGAIALSITPTATLGTYYGVTEFFVRLGAPLDEANVLYTSIRTHNSAGATPADQLGGVDNSRDIDGSLGPGDSVLVAVSANAGGSVLTIDNATIERVT